MEQPNKVSKHNYFLMIFFILIFVLAGLQLYFLSNVGTKGQELSEIKTSQSTIKVENEILRSKVLALKSNQAVLDGLNNHVNVEVKPINFLSPDLNNIAAQF
jgi:hypothetical protein